MIKKLEHLIFIIIQSTLPIILLILGISIMQFIRQDIRIRKEHTIMLKSLEGYGGFSGHESVRQIEEYIDEIHDINNYHWTYTFIDKPFYSSKVKVRYEKGWRRFNAMQCSNLGIKDLSCDGEYDYHNGIDGVVEYDLRLRSGISGKAYVGHDRKAGYYINILSEEFWPDKKLVRYGIKPTGKGKIVQTIIKHYHLSYIDIENGQEVSKGSYIGNIGDSGRAVGLHLHYELWIDGVNRNPFSNSTYNLRVEK